MFPEQANNNEWARYLYYTGGTRGVVLAAPTPQKTSLRLGEGAPRWAVKLGLLGFSQWLFQTALSPA